jgi:hypothetical protein
MLRPWREVAVPHPDVFQRELDEAIFAADLADAVAGRGPLAYRDPETFFQQTYPTAGLVRLMAAVLGRLAGSGSGPAVVQMKTPFGGGKTHSLLALYHLVRAGDRLRALEPVARALALAGLDRVPAAAVVTFVGTAADPIGGRTPWGELAAQLQREALLAAHDRQRRAPGKDLLHTLLADQPVLILMDELVEYVVKARDFADQVLAFLQELTETVKVLPQALLVATLPSSAPYGESGERALHQLEMIFGRMEAIYTPVEGEEIYEVVRRRLFRPLTDEATIQTVTQAYWTLYQDLGENVPEFARQPAYRERMRRAYPFHPEVIDILFERWSTFGTFQRTRGALRLLALVVADLYGRGHSGALIQPADINLGNDRIREEFLRHLESAYEGVIASDIAGPGAKAAAIDASLGETYRPLEVASGLARAVFFYSFSNTPESRGVGAARLRLAVLRPGLPPAIIGDALYRLERELWYLRRENDLYAFGTRPSLAKIIADREEAVDPDRIPGEIRHRLEAVLQGPEPFRVFLFPRGEADVPDDRTLKLAVLAPEAGHTLPETLALASRLLQRAGTTFRAFPNSLWVLVPTTGADTRLRLAARRYLALASIQADKGLVDSLSPSDRGELQERLRTADTGLTSDLLQSYRHLARARGGDADGLEWHDLGLPTVGETRLLERVVRYLQHRDILIDRITPERLRSLAVGEAPERSLREIHDLFLRTPGLPVPRGFEVIATAVAQGVTAGLFGVRVGERVVIGREVAASTLTEESVLVQGVTPPPAVTIPPEAVLTALGTAPERPVAEVVSVLRAQYGTATESAFEQAVLQALQEGVERGLFTLTPRALGEPSLREMVARGVAVQRPVQPARPTRYRLALTLEPGRFNDVFRGVVLPLMKAGATVRLGLEVEATHAEGLPPAVLEQVAEGLRQMPGVTVSREER